LIWQADQTDLLAVDFKFSHLRLSQVFYSNTPEFYSALCQRKFHQNGKRIKNS